MQYLSSASYVPDAIHQCTNIKDLVSALLKIIRWTDIDFNVGLQAFSLSLLFYNLTSLSLSRSLLSPLTQVQKTGEVIVSQANPPNTCFSLWDFRHMCLRRCLWTKWEEFTRSNITYISQDMPSPFFESSKTTEDTSLDSKQNREMRGITELLGDLVLWLLLLHKAKTSHPNAF